MSLPHTRSFHLAAAFVFAAFSAACAPQVDSDYRGEVLAEIGGTITLSASLTAVPPIDVMILWAYDNGDGDQHAGQRVRVEADFPASFRIALNEPPPPSVLKVGPDGNAAAIGYIIALPRGADPTRIEDSLVSPVGVARRNMLVWSRYGIQADTPEARAFGGAMPPGYVLMHVITSAERIARNPALVECDARDFSEGCPALPDWDVDGEAYEEAWAAYETCVAMNAEAAGCSGPPSYRDVMVVAPEGLATPIGLTLVDHPDALVFPEIW